MGWFGDLWTKIWAQDPVVEASQEKLPLEVDTLETRFATIDPSMLANIPRGKEIYDQIASILAKRSCTKELTWNDRFRVESKLGCLRSGEVLRTEIARTLRWAKEDGVPSAVILEEAYGALLKPADPAKTVDDNVLRDFLLEIVSTINAHRRLKFIVGKLQAKAARKILFLVFLILLTIFLFFLEAASPELAQTNAASLVQFISITKAAVFDNSHFGAHLGLYTSALFGLLGALFSRLLTVMQPRKAAVIDELYNAATFRYILARGMIGILGALVVYFFLQSGLVEGNVFPKFNELGMKAISSPGGSDNWPTRLLLPSGSLALLIVWSFIAGFSESLVPTILSNTERQLGGAVNTSR